VFASDWFRECGDFRSRVGVRTRGLSRPEMKYWEIIADNLSKAERDSAPYRRSRPRQRQCSQSSNSRMCHSGFTRKRRPHLIIFSPGIFACVAIHAATSLSSAPVAINSRSREMLAQRCVRAARCTAFQVGSHGAQFFSVHYAMIITQEFRPVEDASNPTSFLTHCESTPPHDSTRVREGENFHGRFLRSEDFSPQNCATRRNSVKVGLVRLAYEKHAAQSHEKVRKSSLGN